MPPSPGIARLVTESAVYGVILVAGLVVIVSNSAEASWDVLVKVLATVVVFWLAHIYAGTVAHLSDHHESDLPAGQRLAHAARHALDHSWGMLVAALLPVTVLLLGVANLVADQVAIWGTLWLAVVVLGALPSVLGLALIGLKILIH